MHRSRLAGLIIDCNTDDLASAAAFWSEALGLRAKAPEAQPSPLYVMFEPSRPQPLHVEVQQVAHPSRVHIDIESDNVDAEVQRLERLGAKRIQRIRSWWVMEAPTGQRFCVVPPQHKDFADNANIWND